MKKKFVAFLLVVLWQGIHPNDPNPTTQKLCWKEICIIKKTNSEGISYWIKNKEKQSEVYLLKPTVQKRIWGYRAFGNTCLLLENSEKFYQKLELFFSRKAVKKLIKEQTTPIVNRKKSYPKLLFHKLRSSIGKK